MIAVAAYLALAAPVQSPPPPALLALSAVSHLAALSQPAATDTAPPARQPAEAPATAAPAEPAGADPRTPGDPHERFNRRMFARYQKIDRGFLRPVALGYKHVVPRGARSGIRHFFANLTEPIVFLNFMLQGKPGKAVETLGRFVINSTFGIGGLLDVAKLPSINLPHRPNGFGDTLGFYGVKPGAFLFLPFVGPTTVRDFFGAQVDAAVLPATVGKPFERLYYQIPRTVLGALDERAQADDDLKTLLGGAVDPYATLRSVYLQDRAAEIAALHGHARAGTEPVPANDNLDDPLTDPAATKAPSSDATELQDPLADPATVPASAPAQTPASGAAAPATPARR